MLSDFDLNSDCENHDDAIAARQRAFASMPPVTCAATGLRLEDMGDAGPEDRGAGRLGAGVPPLTSRPARLGKSPAGFARSPARPLTGQINPGWTRPHATAYYPCGIRVWVAGRTPACYPSRKIWGDG